MTRTGRRRFPILFAPIATLGLAGTAPAKPTGLSAQVSRGKGDKKSGYSGGKGVRRSPSATGGWARERPPFWRTGKGSPGCRQRFGGVA